MNYRWRRITRNDFALIDSWDSDDIRKYVTFGDGFTISEYYEMFADKEFTTSGVALDENGDIIGVILYDHVESIRHKNMTCFNLQLLVVNPKLTNQGHATRMLEDIIESNKEKIDVFKIYVEPDNVVCERLCHKFGFRIYTKRKHYDDSDIYELYMKDLNKNRK